METNFILDGESDTSMWRHTLVLIDKVTGRPTQEIYSLVLLGINTPSNSNTVHPIKIHYIQTKYTTSNQNTLHPIKIHYIQSKYTTSNQNTLHPIKIHYIQSKYTTSNQNTLHPIKIHYIQSK